LQAFDMIRPLWALLGFICLGLGWIGLVMPMMPGFVFLLGALYCFMRGNPAWAARMLDHPFYGPPLRDWQERRAISRKSKISAVIALAVCAVITGFIVGWPLVMLPSTCMTLVAIWIWTRAE